MTDRGKTINIPKELHLKLKYKALENNSSIKDYIIKLLEEHLYEDDE